MKEKGTKKDWAGGETELGCTLEIRRELCSWNGPSELFQFGEQGQAFKACIDHTLGTTLGGGVTLSTQVLFY